MGEGILDSLLNNLDTNTEEELEEIQDTNYPYSTDISKLNERQIEEILVERIKLLGFNPYLHMPIIKLATKNIKEFYRLNKRFEENYFDVDYPVSYMMGDSVEERRQLDPSYSEMWKRSESVRKLLNDLLLTPSASLKIGDTLNKENDTLSQLFKEIEEINIKTKKEALGDE